MIQTILLWAIFYLVCIFVLFYLWLLYRVVCGMVKFIDVWKVYNTKRKIIKWKQKELEKIGTI